MESMKGKRRHMARPIAQTRDMMDALAKAFALLRVIGPGVGQRGP